MSSSWPTRPRRLSPAPEGTRSWCWGWLTPPARMKNGKGKKSSPLDDIRPERWTFTPELLTLIAILEHTIAQTPKAAGLLDRVVSSQVIDAALLPTPTDLERKAPKA